MSHAAANLAASGTAKKLFSSSSSVSSAPPSPSSADEDTRRPSRQQSLGDRSFLADFLPPPELTQGIAGFVSNTARAVVSSVFADLPVSPFQAYTLPPVVDPVLPPPVVHVKVPRTLAVMTTRLPHPKDIKVKEIRSFDGSPSNLDNFDNSVKQMLHGNYLPLYYGGTVQGNPDEGLYEFVAAGTPDSKSNYVLGSSFCAKLTSRFTAEALKWWQDYDTNGNPTPNCWRRHGDKPRPVAGSVPEGVEEVALFDLLRSQFSPDTDAREAELELERFRWKPFEKDGKGMSVTVFKGHMDRLMKRAQLTGVFARVRAIRHCLPPRFKEKVEIEDTEDALWRQIRKIYTTLEVDFVDRECLTCGKSGHTSDNCKWAKKRDPKASTPAGGAEVDFSRPYCTYCKRYGHVEKTCWDKHGRPDKDKTEHSNESSRI